MLSRRNYSEKLRKVTDKKSRYSIRKLSIGATSALIGISFLGFGTHIVHADVHSTDQQAVTQTTMDNKNPENPHNNTAPADVNTWEIGNDSKTYDGSQITKIDAKNFKLTDINNQELNTTSVDNDSFEWVNKDGQPVSDMVPKNVGTYNVKLTDSAVQKLKQDNPNLAEDPGIVASYTIKQGQASATLRGYDSKAIDGKSVTTEDLNKDDKIYVDLNIPGSTETKYQLKDGDYSWYDNNNNALTDAPKEVGSYHVKFTDQGKFNITDYINSLVGSGTEVIDGIEKAVSNVAITFTDSASITGTDSSANATFTIYDPKNIKNAGQAPKGAVWTPAGWTNSNPDYVVKSATVNIYQSGKNNIDNFNTLKSNYNISDHTLFGTDISAKIDKNDLKIGNKILLATITTTNDYTLDPDKQLPLSIASTENGRAVKALGTNKIIGRIIVSKLNNGEIDYWLDVTDTDTYGEDVTINNLKDYETGYINASTDFSDLANLRKNGKPLNNKDTITQNISTVSNTYTQTYTISTIGNGIKNITDIPTTWASGSKPTMSANYTNPALNLKKNDLQNIAKNGVKITPTDYYKVFFIQGDNIDFSNLTTWERLEISPVDGKQIKFESSDLVKDKNGNLTRLDKNTKKAIRLGNNLAVKDVIAETPDGQSAYSMLKDDSAIVVVKVNHNDVKLSDDEIASYVKSSQYYNMQSDRNSNVINNTKNFYHNIDNQSLRTAIMISVDLKDVDSNEGWGNISDITPNSTQASELKDKGIRYQHGQASADANVFRTAQIGYYDVDTKETISNEVRTVLTGEEGTTSIYSVNIPLGYKFDHLLFGNSKVTSNKDKKSGMLTFDYVFNKDESKNPSISIYLKKISENNYYPHLVTYTAIDDETGRTLTVGTQLGVYMLDDTSKNGFDGSKNSNTVAANQAYNKVLNDFENNGFVLSKNSSIVDWANVKNNGYKLTIHLEHGKTIVMPDKNNWPADMSSTDKVALTKTITRKVSVNGLPYIISPETQVARFTRKVIVDNVTKKIIKYVKNGQEIDPTTDDMNTWNLDIDDWKEYSVDSSYVPTGFYIDTVTIKNSKINYTGVKKLLVFQK